MTVQEDAASIAVLEPTTRLRLADGRTLDLWVDEADEGAALTPLVFHSGTPASGYGYDVFAAQAREVFRSLEAQVEAGGATLHDVVKLTTYLTDIRYRDPVYQVMGRWLKGVFPVSTGVVVSALARPEWLVEIDATAVIPRDRAAKDTP